MYVIKEEIYRTKDKKKVKAYQVGVGYSKVKFF